MKKFVSVALSLAMVLSLCACGGAESKRGESFETGSNQNGEYKNSFLGIGCKLDENWTLLSDEEIKMNNESTSAILGDDYSKALENGATLIDMMATYSNATDSVNVSISSVSLQGALVDIDTYAEATAPMFEEPMAAMGIQNLVTRVIDYKFAGIDCKAVSMHGMLSVALDDTSSIDVDIYEKVVMFKKGTYVASVSACSFFEDHTDEYLSLFYGLE